jgi:IS30 family transposase
VSREIVRHGGHPAYRAHDADGQAWQSAVRPKHCLLAMNRKLRNIVARKLILDWSTEQISGWLKKQYANDEGMRVSHETIYRSLFIQARGVLKRELMDHLRSKRRMRRSAISASMDTHGGRSSMPSRSANGQRRRKTERSLATGKAICWPEERIATLQRSWSGIQDFSC